MTQVCDLNDGNLNRGSDLRNEALTEAIQELVCSVRRRFDEPFNLAFLFCEERRLIPFEVGDHLNQASTG